MFSINMVHIFVYFQIKNKNKRTKMDINIGIFILNKRYVYIILGQNFKTLELQTENGDWVDQQS